MGTVYREWKFCGRFYGVTVGIIVVTFIKRMEIVWQIVWSDRRHNCSDIYKGNGNCVADCME
jgi:hypothetical protein